MKTNLREPMRPGAMILISCALFTLASCGWFSGTKRSAPPPVPAFTPSAQLAAAWRVNIAKNTTSAFTPALADGVVYAAAPDGQVAAFDARNGQQRWRVNVGSALSSGVGIGADMVLVGTRKGEVFALDLKGKTLWRSQLSSEVIAAPQGTSTTVVARTTDGRVFGLEAANGKRRWLYQRALPALTLRNHAPIALSGEIALIGMPGGKLAAVRLDNGNVQWEATVAIPQGVTELERIADVAALPVVDDKRACAGAFQGRLACFDLTSGNVIWSRELSTSVPVALDERAIYAVDDAGAVFAFDKSGGASLWKQDKLQGRRLAGPVLVGNRVMVGDEQGFVTLLAKENGELAARQPADGSAIGASASEGQRLTYTQTRNGNLFAFAAN